MQNQGVEAQNVLKVPDSCAEALRVSIMLCDDCYLLKAIAGRVNLQGQTEWCVQLKT